VWLCRLFGEWPVNRRRVKAAMFEQRHGTFIVADINTETLLSAQTTCCKVMTQNATTVIAIYIITSPSVEMRSTVCQCVCLFLCLFVCPLAYLTSHKISAVYMLSVSAARSSSDDSAICYVLPVLWMTPYCFYVMEPLGQNPKTKRMFCRVRQAPSPGAKLLFDIASSYFTIWAYILARIPCTRLLTDKCCRAFALSLIIDDRIRTKLKLWIEQDNAVRVMSPDLFSA